MERQRLPQLRPSAPASRHDFRDTDDVQPNPLFATMGPPPSRDLNQGHGHRNVHLGPHQSKHLHCNG